MRSPDSEPKHIVMLLSNPFRPDPRVLKEARSLVKEGFRVSLLSWDRKGEFPPIERIAGIQVIRFQIQSGYSAGSRQIFYLPRFWMQAYQTLSKLAPDIVHCHDLDTTLPGYFYARAHRIPWVFDAHECYPEQIGPQVHPFLYRGLLWLEKTIAPRANYVITVGELLAERFESFGAKTEIVGNYPELDKFKSSPDLVTRSSLDIPLHDMVVAYIGGFTQAREILPLLESSNLVPTTSILLAGDGPQRADIEAALPRYHKVRYLGWISQDMVPAYTSATDVIYYGLKTANGNSQYSTPNALFNAMAAGKPVITTNIGEIARIVKNIECGLVIPAATAEQIASAIVLLKDDNLRLQMGTNARNASASTYNWGHAQEKLVRVYRHL